MLLGLLHKIFKLKLLAQSIIRSVIGNGESTFLWLDNWHPLGPLYLVSGDRIRFNMGRNLHAKVSSVIVDSRWNWPRSRSSVTQEIMQATPVSFVPYPERDDRVIWSVSPSGEYSSKSAWLAINEEFLRWIGIGWFGLKVMCPDGPS